MSNHGFINVSEPFLSIWSNAGHGRFRWVSSDFWEFFCQNRLIQVWKSMLKHRTHSWLYKSSRLKVDFSIQLLVKFQILINFLRQMLDFCLGCGNKKCWVWFLALIFLLLTFLFFWGNTYEAVQPVKTTIFSCRKITFEREFASYRPVFLHYSWIFDSGTLIQIVSAGILSWKLDAWCYFITSDPSLVDL